MSSKSDAASLRCTVRPGPPARRSGCAVGEQEDVGLDALLSVKPEPEDAHRHPWVVGRDRGHDRRAVADALAEVAGALGVELGGHEHGAARGVEVEYLGRVGREEEAVLQRPLADLVAAAGEDRDVERVDLRLEDDLNSSVESCRCRRGVVAGFGDGGATSSARRCSVQSPPRSTDVGTSGSGTIDPTDSPSPVNSNDVT